MKRYILYFLNILLVSVFTSCEVEEFKVTFGEKKTHTLTLRLNTGDMQSRTIIGEDTRNENLIQTLDCFFYTSEDKDAVCYKSATIPAAGLNGTGEHSVNISFEDDELKDLFGDDYRDNGNSKTCFIYIIANRPKTISITGTETIMALKSKTLEGSFATLANQDNFVMDSGTVTTNENSEYVYDIDEIELTIAENTASLSGHVDLYRSAAKIGLFVHVPEFIENGEGENATVWTPVEGSMKVKFHKGVKKGNIDNRLVSYAITGDDYFDTAETTFTTLDETSSIEEGSLTYDQTTEYPFYTYPTSTAEGQGTYFTLYLSWKSQTAGADTDEESDDAYQYKNCTYQIPVNKLEALERNNYYRLLLNVGVLGTESDVVTLEPSYTILDWNEETIDTDIEENVYLVVNEHNVTINNKNSYAVEFTSSHPVEAQIVSITQPYYKSEIARITNFYDESNGSGDDIVKLGTVGSVPGVTFNAQNQPPTLYRDCSVSVQGNTIVLNHEVVNMGADGAGTNYDIAPYTIKVYVKMVYGTGANQYFEDTIEFIQYPAIYVVAKQNSDYTATQSNWNTNRNVFVNSYYTVGWNGRTYYHSATGSSDNVTQSRFGIVPGLCADGPGNTNPNMYVVHVGSLSNNNHIIGDPRENNPYTPTGVTWADAPAIYPSSASRKLQNYYRTDPSGINSNVTPGSSDDANNYITGNVIAPAFRIASSYSVTQGMDSHTTAQNRCASYQEDGYPAGRWRMPTFAEVQFVCTLSSQGKIPVLFTNGINYWCAHGIFSPSNTNVSLGSSNSASSIRCVYDEWYWGSEPAVQKDTNGRDLFTWGDYPRDAWHGHQAATN